VSTSAPSLQFDVVIAGGGFAGIYCARTLEKQLGGEARKRVALIADQNFMVFQPMLAEVVGSSISPRHVVNPIRRLCPGVTVLRGSISGIDLPGRRLEVNAGDFTGNVTIGFEHLVLSLGGIVDLSRVPGMPEHAFLLKNVGDALKLRATVIDRFEEANLEPREDAQRRLLTFVIVGGGYSGVEVAGQINDLGEEILSFYPRLRRESFRVVLIHSGTHLLPEISESLGQYCEENLQSRGVELILGTRVHAITSGKVFCPDREIESHTIVSTIGNAPHPLLSELCRAHDLGCEKGRLLTQPTLQIRGQTHLWAAGDCAAVPMPAPASASPTDARTFCPPTAQFAMRQGALLGENIARVITGDDEPQPFTFTGLGELASIGHRAAVAEILGMKFSGFFAWWLWRTVYLSKLPGVERKLRVLLDWTLDLFFPRGLDHHEMFAGVPVAEKVMAKVARQLAGLGLLPDQEAPPKLPARNLNTRVAIVGGGAAGLAAARVLADRGVPFLLFERDEAVGGRLTRGAPLPDDPAVANAASFPKGSIVTRAHAIGLYDDEGGRFLAIGAHEPEGLRLLKVYADRFLLAPGGHPALIPFENNDLPGVYAGRAASLLLREYGVAPEKAALVGWGVELYALARLLESRGTQITAVVDLQGPVPADAPAGACVGSEPKAHGSKQVSAFSYKREGGKRKKVDCDAVLVSVPPSPSFELARQGGASVDFDAQRGLFVVRAEADGRTAAADVFVAGDITGGGSAQQAAASGTRAAEALLGGLS